MLIISPQTVYSPFFTCTAHILDGVNLQGYFAYGLNDLLDPGFGMYGYVQDEVFEKASLSHYRNIIDHNGFPAPESPPQQCPRPAEPCSGSPPC